MSGMDSDAAIEVSQLRYSYDNYLAVDGVDFTVRAGEIFALLGTNGAGKTTTLEIVEGFRAPATGSVRVLNHDPYNARTRLASHVGIMLQDSGLIDELTVTETLRLWAQLSSRTDHIPDLLDDVGLAERAASTIEKLSGGEKRRLDFALSIWGRPDVVILDEPTTGLDPESRQRLWKTVGRLRDNGSTILLTTHYLEEAEALADRVAIMHQGRVSVSGTLADVVGTHPARITAEMPAHTAARLPHLSGNLNATTVSEGTSIVIETYELQDDLTELLNWAQANSIRLRRLNATQASLQDIFLGIGELEAV